MAASKAQGSRFALFMVGATVTCAGLASWSGGLGKLLFIVGLLITAASLVMSAGLKAAEGKVAQRPGAEGGKLGGALLALIGWLVTFIGIQVVTSTGGRILLALVGIATSLFGIVVVLPAAINKNAIWKA